MQEISIASQENEKAQQNEQHQSAPQAAEVVVWLFQTRGPRW